MVYIIIAGFLCVLSVFELKYNGKGTAKTGIIIVTVLIIFAGLRKNVGLDYDNYELLYSWLKDKSLVTGNIDYGWFFLNRILPSFRVVLIATAFLTVMIKWSAFQNLLNGQYIATAFFFYFTTLFMYYDMGIIRQGVSIGLCYYSIKYIKRRSVYFFICIGIAFLFHTSALVFMPLYFMGNKEYSRRFYYGILGLLFTASALVESLRNIIIPLIGRFGGGLINYRLNFYDSYDVDFNMDSLFFSFLRRAMFLIFFIEIYKRKSRIRVGRGIAYDTRDSRKYTWIYINGYFLSSAVMIIFSLLGFESLAGRLCASLYSLYIFIYIDIISENKLKGINRLYYIVFVLLAFITMTNTVFKSEGYIPYCIGW